MKNPVTTTTALIVAIIGVLFAFGVISDIEQKALVQVVGPIVSIVIALILARAKDKGGGL